MKIRITPRYSLQVRAECVDFLRHDGQVETVILCLTHSEYNELKEAQRAAESLFKTLYPEKA